MRTWKTTIGLVLAVLVAGATNITRADQLVSYAIHADPNDPNSDVTFQVTLTLEEVSRDGNQVCWELALMTLEQLGPQARTWANDEVLFITTSGYWCVDHADPDNPVAEEFVEPPPISGTGLLQSGTGDDLDFVIEGVAYTPGGGGPPYAVTGALDYTFILVNANDPLMAGDGEPVDVGSDGMGT